MMEVWYVMEDGSFGDPSECVEVDGVLKHSDGRAVAYRPSGPVSRAVDPADHKKEAKQMEPEQPRKRYRTRDMKAR